MNFLSTRFKFLVCLGAFLVAFMPCFSFISQAADTTCKGLTQVQCLQKRSEIAQQIKKAQEEAAQKKKDAEELQKLVSQLDSSLSATQTKINNTQNQINKTQKEIDETSVQIKEKEKELKVEQDNQDEAIRVMYETVNKSTLEILASSDDISDVVKYGDYLDGLENKIEDTINQINKLKQELEDKKTELENKKKEAEKLKIDLQVQQDNLAEQRDIKNTLLTQTNSAVSALKEQIEQEQKQQQLVDAQLAQYNASKKYSGPTFYGEWAYPLPQPIIVTCEFHDPTYPYGTHTGIDLRAAQGTPVYAAGDGVVIIAVPPVDAVHYSYIAIDHGNNIDTLYYHMSAIYVSPGQIVKRGQTIGLSGGTPGSPGAGPLTTGAHLHFEYRVSNTPVNPRVYLQF